MPEIPRMPEIPNLAEMMNSLSRPRLPDLRMPEIQPSPLVTSVTANYASEFYERLTKWINTFNDSLDDQHEVGVRLVNFGQTITFHLAGLGYWNPSLIMFNGSTDSGDPVELIQHVTQISILLMKVPRKDPGKPKRPIGFDPAPVPSESNEEQK